MDQPLDFSTPLILFCVALVLLLFAAPLLIHGLFRRHRFPALAQKFQTYANGANIRAELIVAGCLMVGVILCAVGSAVLYGQATEALEYNLAVKYPMVTFDLGYWNGSWMNAQATLADGTQISNVQIVLDDFGEPFATGIDELIHDDLPE